MRFAQEISIFNPHAIEMAVVALGTQITQTADEIRLEAAQTLSNYSTTAQMNAAISTKANEITLEVSQTYATQQSVNNSVSSLSTRITQNANSITSEVTARGNADSALSSRIRQTLKSITFNITNNSTNTAATLSMSVTNEGGSTTALASKSINLTGLVTFTNLSTSGQTSINGSNITTGTIKDANSNTVFNLSTGALTIKKGSINLGNGNFSVTDAGILTIKRGSINLGNGNFSVTDSGALTAKTGSIGGFTINSDSLSGGAIYQTVSGAGTGGWNPSVNGTQAYIRNGQVACGQLTLNGGTSFYAEGYDDSAEGQTGILCNGHFSTRSTLWVGRGSGDVIAYFRGYISSQGDVGVSDRNLKHHEYYLGKEAEDFIYSLEPVAFRWKDKDTAIHHGFYAQDVEKVKYDDWGIVTEADGHKGLFYTELIADLVATVQAQDKRIKALEAQHG